MVDIWNSNFLQLTLCSQTILYTSGFASISHSKYTSLPSAMFDGSKLVPNFRLTIGESKIRQFFSLHKYPTYFEYLIPKSMLQRLRRFKLYNSYFWKLLGSTLSNGVSWSSKHFHAEVIDVFLVNFSQLIQNQIKVACESYLKACQSCREIGSM